MSNYPFETFPLTKRVGIVNPVANLDARYGPWPTFNDALTGFSNLVRHVGLTVAVTGVGGITEYWYKNGIANSDLVLKTAQDTNFANVSGKYESVATTFISNSANYILDGGNTKSATLSVGTNDNFGLVLETNSAPRITITNTGNVGIGLTTPTDRLEVGGTLRLTGTLPTIRTTTNRFSVNETAFSPSNETGMVSQFSSGSYGRSIFAITHTAVNTSFFGLDNFLFSIGGESNTDIRFVKGLSYGAVDILNSGSEIMRIKASNSSVGVGTNNPNERLTVSGNISADGLSYANNFIPNTIILTSNLPFNTNNTINPGLHRVVYQTVSADNNYVFNNFSLGSTVTLFISGNHNSIKRHKLLGTLLSFNVNGAGQSDQFYTFSGHTTKVTLTRVFPTLGFVSNARIIGTAEIIRTDLNQSQGGLGFITLETATGPTDFLLQEDGDRLVIRNFV